MSCMSLTEILQTSLIGTIIMIAYVNSWFSKTISSVKSKHKFVLFECVSKHYVQVDIGYK